jgi:hypothetical protein
MTGAVPAATCKREGCDNLVEQAPGSHWPRQYCSDTCKQGDYRQRAKEKLLARRQAELRERWGDLLSETLEQLDIMLRELGEEAVQRMVAVIVAEKQQVTSAEDKREACSRSYQSKQRLEEVERELTRYRQLCDLDDRPHLLAQAAALGAQIGYKALLAIDPPVRAGEASWSERLQQADTEDLARIIAVARHFAENLIWLEVHDELQRAQRRIADLERQVERNQMSAVSSQPGA